MRQKGSEGAACGPRDVLLRQHDAGPGAHDVQLRCMMCALCARFDNVVGRETDIKNPRRAGVFYPI